jgi:hypothetical protein
MMSHPRRDGLQTTGATMLAPRAVPLSTATEIGIWPNHEDWARSRSRDRDRDRAGFSWPRTRGPRPSRLSAPGPAGYHTCHTPIAIIEDTYREEAAQRTDGERRATVRVTDRSLSWKNQAFRPGPDLDLWLIETL